MEEKVKGARELSNTTSHGAEGGTEDPKGNSAAPDRVDSNPGCCAHLLKPLSHPAAQALRLSCRSRLWSSLPEAKKTGLSMVRHCVLRARTGQGPAGRWLRRAGENSFPLRATLSPHLWRSGAQSAPTPHETAQPACGSKAREERKAHGPPCQPHWRARLQGCEWEPSCPLGKETCDVSLLGHQSVQEQAQLFLVVTCQA